MKLRLSCYGLILILATALASSGCGGGNSVSSSSTGAQLSVLTTSPLAGATGVSPSGNVKVTFNQPMNSASLNSNTFTLTGPSGPNKKLLTLSATISCSGNVATLSPAVPLAPNTVYTVALTSGAQDLAGTSLGGNPSFTFTTAASDTAPIITAFTPSANSTGVSPSTNLNVSFSEAMNPASMTTATIILMTPSGAIVPGSVSYANNIAVFSPSAPLNSNTPYKATVTTGVQDISGTPLGNSHVWTFTTGGVDIAPTILAFTPSSKTTGVSTSANLNVTFSEAMNPASITTSSIVLTAVGGAIVAGTVSYANDTAVFNPTTPLQSNMPYTATVTTGCTDIDGTPLANSHVWPFTTGGVDIAPTILAFTPSEKSTGDSTNSTINVTFSEAMTASSLTTATIYLTAPDGTIVAGTVTYANDVAVLTPSSPLAANTFYVATVTTGCLDIDVTPLGNSHVWSFTTG